MTTMTMRLAGSTEKRVNAAIAVALECAGHAATVEEAAMLEEVAMLLALAEGKLRAVAKGETIHRPIVWEEAA